MSVLCECEHIHCIAARTVHENEREGEHATTSISSSDTHRFLPSLAIRSCVYVCVCVCVRGFLSSFAIRAQFFGNYVQLGVWIVTLSFAGYSGLQKINEEPESVGMLLAPPLAAVFLIGSFLVYRIATSVNEDDSSSSSM